MIAMFGTSDQSCWLAKAFEACKILVLLLNCMMACSQQTKPCGEATAAFSASYACASLPAGFCDPYNSPWIIAYSVCL